MSHALPYSGSIEMFDVCNVGDHADVAVHYTDQLHTILCTRNKRHVFASSTSSVQTLLTTLSDKENYVLHYRNLKFYLSRLRIKAIHRVFCFNQNSWLKPFIDCNTDKRNTAVNSNKAIYGKSLKNVRKRIDFQVVSDEQTSE